MHMLSDMTYLQTLISHGLNQVLKVLGILNSVHIWDRHLLKLLLVVKI